MATHKNAVLIVDDEELICRGILRELKGRFHLVFTAAGQGEAEAILNRGDITILICDYFLGASSPRGTELLEKWRKSYPSIEKAVLYTATDPASIPPSEGVDATLSKAISPGEIYRILAALPDEVGVESLPPVPAAHSVC